MSRRTSYGQATQDYRIRMSLFRLGVKDCNGCGETKPLDGFTPDDSANQTGRKGKCKDCCATYARKNGRRHRYGIDFDATLAAQGGACAICREVAPRRDSTDGWAVDHDHNCCPEGNACGKCVRGILCHNCNIGIGNLGDDPNRLLAAAAYLTQ